MDSVSRFSFSLSLNLRAVSPSRPSSPSGGEGFLLRAKLLKSRQRHNGGFSIERIHMMPRSLVVGCALWLLGSVPLPAADESPTLAMKLIFDTDMGNDIDDALALGVIHALQSRSECTLLAVTLSKDNELAGPFVDLINKIGRAHV